jgi:hypothetical protein
VQTRFLEDLAERAGLVGLAVFRLALGECPVVVARPVDEQNLTAPQDEAAGRSDEAHFAARSSSRHAFRHDARALARRARSCSIRRPAASA